jgi:mannosyltransferase
MAASTGPGLTVAIDGIIFSLQRAGGISVYFQELLRVLGERGHAATLTLEQPLRQALLHPSGPVTARHLAARRLERYRRARVAAQATVFHSSYYRRPDRPGVPSVVTVYDFIYERFRHGPARWVHMQQKHAAIREAQAVICISEATRREMRHWMGEIPGQAVHVVHCAVGAAFRPLELGADGAPFVLFVGERSGYKNFDLALKALEFLPGLELRCVGGGALRADELEGVGSAVRERVRHLGFVDEVTLNAAYNRAECLLYPSSYEGFGIPTLEAMRAGCPVVSLACDAVLEVGGPALTVAEAARPEAIAAAVQSVREPERRARLVRAGLERAAGFSWDTAHARTLEIYRSLAGA